VKTKVQSQALWIGAGALAGGSLPLLLYWLQAATIIPPEQTATVHRIHPFEEWVVVVTAFGAKPAYMLISLACVVWLWRQRSPDLVALRRGLLVFWLGEAACAVNFTVFQGFSDLWEYFHNFGMAVGFSFVTYAVLDGIDRRLVKYSAAKDRCAALSLCRACIKYADVPCGLRRVFAMLIPATMVVACMPLCVGLKPSVFDTHVFGSPVHYAEALSDQLFEIRYCPALALVLLAASWLVLQFKRVEPVPLAKVLFAAAMGPLGFGLMRLFLTAAYHENAVWSNAWEELTELLFTIAVAFMLWVFRPALFAPETSSAANQMDSTGAVA